MQGAGCIALILGTRFYLVTTLDSQVLQKRMSEVLEFIDKNRETLHRMPLLAVQQAANQPAHSAPEVAALVSLVFEPSSSARFGMRTEQAQALESSRLTTTGHLLEYSPAMARLSVSNIPGTKAVSFGMSLTNPNFPLKVGRLSIESWLMQHLIPGGSNGDAFNSTLLAKSFVTETLAK